MDGSLHKAMGEHDVDVHTHTAHSHAHTKAHACTLTDTATHINAYIVTDTYIHILVKFNNCELHFKKSETKK